MTKATDEDIQALIAEMKHLRADFARIGELLKQTARNGTADAADTIREKAEHGWNEAKATAKSVFEEMEERPLGMAFVAFIAGMLLALLVGGRR